ncbi:helix-turn-helix domain-containing protein [Oceaniglobus trochenteri]|uniref:helix-turn-helix domain-containing protein n=1 Tax=Oceaniglobus trochenteri TaxID=2763260 RepID=UPI001CFF7CA4|nr:helix-turn-helix domain-containing protein [Oceaniglobus trochenteri]
MEEEAGDQPYIFQQTGLRGRRGPPLLMEQGHTHSDIEINYLESGQVEYEFLGTRVTCGPGKMYIFSGVTPHRTVSIAEGTILTWITLPAVFLHRWELPKWFLDALFSGVLLEERSDRSLEVDKQQLATWLADMKSGHPKLLQVAILEMRARIVRMAIQRHQNRMVTPKDSNRHQRDASIATARMKSFIFGNLASPITLFDIASAAGLHRNYAGQVFKGQTGRTPIAFLTEQRIAFACYLLLTSDRKVIEISLDCGFGSLSRFYDAFVRHVGVTPTAFRSRDRSRNPGR